MQRVSGGWVSTGVPWTYDAERYERVAAARRAEQQLMIDYERSDSCRMAFLQETLDDDTAVACGRCDGCAGPWYPTSVPDAVVGAARERLTRAGVDLEPIRQIQGALMVLGQDRASAVLSECAQEIERFAAPGFTPQANDFETVAKKLSALGFFVTQLQAGAADIDAILEPPAAVKPVREEAEAAQT